MIDTRGVQRGARAGGLCFGIENFRRGDQVAVSVASTSDQNQAIGERGRCLTCARHDEIAELLDLKRTGSAHPRCDRQHDGRAEEREKVSEDVISFGSSLHIRGASFVEGSLGSLGASGELLGGYWGVTGGLLG